MIPPVSETSSHLYIRLGRSELVYLKCILEGYDNLAYFSVVDKMAAVVECFYAPQQEKELLVLLSALCEEINAEFFFAQGSRAGV